MLTPVMLTKTRASCIKGTVTLAAVNSQIKLTMLRSHLNVEHTMKTTRNIEFC